MLNIFNEFCIFVLFCCLNTNMKSLSNFWMFFTIFSAKKFRWLGQIFCRIWQTGQHSNLLVILLASQVLNAQVTFWSEEQKMSKRSINLFFKIKKPSVQRNVHNFENNFTLVEVLKGFRSILPVSKETFTALNYWL